MRKEIRQKQKYTSKSGNIILHLESVHCRPKKKKHSPPPNHDVTMKGPLRMRVTSVFLDFSLHFNFLLFLSHLDLATEFFFSLFPFKIVFSFLLSFFLCQEKVFKKEKTSKGVLHPPSTSTISVTFSNEAYRSYESEGPGGCCCCGCCCCCCCWDEELPGLLRRVESPRGDDPIGGMYGGG